MLLEAHSLKLRTLAGCAALALASASWAQTSTPEAVQVQIPAGFGAAPSAAEAAAGEAAGREVVKAILDAYEQKKTAPSVTATAQQTRKFADSIADEAMQASRDEVLEFLGIPANGTSAVYVFVSYSMPLPMLRAYAIEAMWSGATLVVRGVPPGKDLGDFITSDLRQLVYGKGAAANISIDPRLFDAYGVTAAPTIVLSTVREDIQCQGAGDVPVQLEEGKSASYTSCPPLSEDSYWKLSGGVSLGFALQSFKDAGAAPAEVHLEALARGLATGTTSSKAQVPFSGKWDDVLSPSAQKAAIDAANGMTRLGR